MKRRNMRGGGSLIAVGTIVGTLAGGSFGQPVVGLLAGLAAGAALAVLLWAADRR